MHKTEEMTFQALSARADEVQTENTVADIIDGEDRREITAFLEFDQSCDMRGDDVTYRLESKRIIGVALCDLDDPQAEIEIWDRDTVWERLGRDWVENSEAAQ
jgi:hypothetical protein